MTTYVKTVCTALGLIFAVMFATSYVRVQEQRAQQDRELAEIKAKKEAALEKWRNDIISACAAEKLDAVDIEPPHTPKCYDPVTGLMTIPRELFAIRGRM